MLLSVIAVLPFALLALLRLGSDDTLAGVTFEAKPVLVTGTAREVTDEKPVKLTLGWEKGDQLVAPRWSGTITDVAARVGGTLRSGDRVVDVDGVGRVAFASNPPFYRPIVPGESGKDVAELHRLLEIMGFLKSLPLDPGTATFATATAVRSFSAAIGIEQTTSVFDPAWVVWLPSDPFPVGALDLRIGRPAPGAGQAFAEAPAALTRAQLSAAGQDALMLDPSVGWVLESGTKTFAVDAASLEVNDEALSDLAATLKTGTESAPAMVRRATTLKAVAVPSVGVMTGANGKLCIWVPVANGYEARAVTLNGARAGVSNVVSGLSAGEQLLANPAQVLEKPQCPSN